MLNKLIPLFVLFICLTFTQVWGHIGSVYSCYMCQGAICHQEKPKNMSIKCYNLDKCVSVFEGSKILEKGCFSHLSETMREKCRKFDNNECHVCGNEYCNNKGPTKCIQCNGINRGYDCFYHPEKIAPTFCPLSPEGKLAIKCFSRRELNDSRDWGRIVRGCFFDETQADNCGKELQKCITCNATMNVGCNKHFLPVYFESFMWEEQRKNDLLNSGTSDKKFSFKFMVIISIGLVFKCLPSK